MCFCCSVNIFESDSRSADTEIKGKRGSRTPHSQIGGRKMQINDYKVV